MRLLIFTLLLFMSLSLGAADNLIVRQSTGDSSFAIGQISQVTFPTDGSGVVLHFTDGTSQTFARSQFVSLRFNGDVSGLEMIGRTQEAALVYNAATSTIVLIGSEAPIFVYSANGSLVAEGTEATLNVAHLANGAYIVKAGSLTSKIVKR